jgi:hypothetical protein
MSQQNTSARVLAFGIFTGFGILFAEQVNHINTPSWNNTWETSEKTRQSN